ncbi:centromere protein H-like [Haliotis rufescens]|uniref:centromere protein H-like n=1 Tax=Haliotis rufescens TaxID=6454 RepID=UPI001EAFD338|nr:centromere protein H-like [Haliotis rufescens]
MSISQQTLPYSIAVDIVEEESISTDNHIVPAETVNDIIATRDWLDGQLVNQLSQIQADQADVPLTKDVEVARERMSRLQEELLSESSKLSLRELTLKRLQLGTALSQELFGPTDPDGPTVDNTVKKELEDMVLQQSNLVSKIMKEEAELEMLHTELKTLREKNFEMKAQNRRSMNQIRQRQKLLEEKADDFRQHKEGQSKKEQLEGEMTKIVIQRHTLQGLILGSGINWAADPAMEELLLSLGEPLNL